MSLASRNPSLRLLNKSHQASLHDHPAGYVLNGLPRAPEKFLHDATLSLCCQHTAENVQDSKDVGSDKSLNSEDLQHQTEMSLYNIIIARAYDGAEVDEVGN